MWPSGWRILDNFKCISGQIGTFYALKKKDIPYDKNIHFFFPFLNPLLRDYVAWSGRLKVLNVSFVISEVWWFLGDLIFKLYDKCIIEAIMYLLYRYIPKEIAYIKNMKLYFGPIFTQTLSNSKKLVCAVSTWTSGGLIKLSLEHPESSLL